MNKRDQGRGVMTLLIILGVTCASAVADECKSNDWRCSVRQKQFAALQAAGLKSLPDQADSKTEVVSSSESNTGTSKFGSIGKAADPYGNLRGSTKLGKTDQTASVTNTANNSVNNVPSFSNATAPSAVGPGSSANDQSTNGQPADTALYSSQSVGASNNKSTSGGMIYR